MSKTAALLNAVINLTLCPTIFDEIITKQKNLRREDDVNEQLLLENSDLLDKIEEMQNEKRKYDIEDNSLELYKISEDLKNSLEEVKKYKQQLSQERFMNMKLSTDIEKTRKSYETAMKDNQASKK